MEARIEGNVMIFPWVRRREPVPNVLLQFVTCQSLSAFPTIRQHQDITDVSVCLCRLLFHVGFLTLSQTRANLFSAEKHTKSFQDAVVGGFAI